MITATEARHSVALTDAEKTELDRIEKAVEASVFPDKKWDGLARQFTIYVNESVAPVGAVYFDPGILDSAPRLMNIFKYRREDDGWIVGLMPDSDAFGQLIGFVFTLEPLPRPATPAAYSNGSNGHSRHLHTVPQQQVGTPWFGEEFALPVRPLLSVIFGTYNRIEHVQRAVASVRRSARRIDYEMVICDGGSTDGSREWLAAQPDVVLVGERHLDGAVKAFNQCYSICRGEFIANLNDDCVVQGEALSSGVRYMQERPKVGQVAFGFRGDGEEWHINEIYEPDKHPNVTWPTTYANFGITRRTVADKVASIYGGLWNPVYKTYAADCELSAWIWKLGYRVDRLPHLRVLDTRADDSLRASNNKTSGLEAKRMYARWPAEAFRESGPDPRVSKEELARLHSLRDGKADTAPKKEEDVLAQVVELVGWPAAEEERRLRKVSQAIRGLDPVDGQFPVRAEFGKERVLHVSLCTDVDPQNGLVRALKLLGSRGYKEVRWYADFSRDPVARQLAIIDAAMTIKPTLIFMQLQTKGAVEVETVRQLRTIAELQNTNCVIVTWCGDIADVNSPWTVDWQADLGRVVDLNLHASFSHVRAMRAAGIHNAGYLNIGYDAQQYCPKPKSFPEERPLKDYDVCFLGSHYGGGDVFSASMARHDAYLRDQAVGAMRDAFGTRFGLFGSGWGGNPHTVPLANAHDVYQRSAIGLNVSLANFLSCYTSDRLFRTMGCGALLLTKSFPGMSVLGLKHGENCLAWETAEDAVALAKGIVNDGRLLDIAAAGLKLVSDNHTWTTRMLELGAYVSAVRSAR